MTDDGHTPENPPAVPNRERDDKARAHPTVPMPAAGPHADPNLTAPEKTPGTGSLPDPDNPQEGDATTG